MADWSISVPLSALADLQSLPGRMDTAETELKRLRSENIGLHRQISELMTLVGDLRREMRKEKHGG